MESSLCTAPSGPIWASQPAAQQVEADAEVEARAGGRRARPAVEVGADVVGEQRGLLVGGGEADPVGHVVDGAVARVGAPGVGVALGGHVPVVGERIAGGRHAVGLVRIARGELLAVYIERRIRIALVPVLGPEVEAVDDYTVKVTTAPDDTGKLQSLPQFLTSASNPSLGIQDSKLVKEHGGTDAADAKDTDKAKEWLDQNSAGSGPYVLVKWSPKAEIELDVNKNYWGSAPFFDKVVIKHVSDPTTQLQMLELGDADMLGTLDTDLVEQAKANPDITVSVDQTLDKNYLAMVDHL